MKEKTIIHVDGNNFFAGCEIMMNPALKGRAVCVLSNNDGCVVARSYEAKKMGIPMGIPYFMAKNQFKNVVYLSADFSLYHEISSRMMQLLYRYSDKVDIYSIDEAFLDVTGFDKIFGLSEKDFVEKIKREIEEDIGLSVSVGMAPTKMLAKLATHKAKQKTGTYVINKDFISFELQNIKTEEIWGIGKNTARSLRKFGIFYAHEIILKDDEFYKINFGKRGMELKYELSGISVIPLTGEVESPKSIQRTRAFPDFSSDIEYIKTEIMIHLHNVCKKLRECNLMTASIAVMLRTKDFRVFYADEKLEEMTNSEILLTEKIFKLFEKIYQPNIVYRSSGVLAFSLEDTAKSQLSLFKDEKKAKCEKLSLLIDKLENKFGKGSLSAGDIGIKAVMKKHQREMRHREF